MSKPSVPGPTDMLVFAKAPDLVETAVSNPPGSVTWGDSFNVTDTTANAGNVPAGASTTRYWLGPVFGEVGIWKLLTGSRAVPPLAAGAISTGTVTVSVPAGTIAGTYRLYACADDLKVVPETNESNNCLRSAGTVRVRPPIPPPSP